MRWPSYKGRLVASLYWTEKIEHYTKDGFNVVFELRRVRKHTRASVSPKFDQLAEMVVLNK